MVKGLVGLHGGSVNIESPGPGLGTSVTVSLPIQDAACAGVTAASPPAAPHRRVLVVDDNADSAETLRDALVLGGNEVHTAYDGPTALAVAHDVLPEVVICDIGLPGMDGYDVARALRGDEHLRGARLIALSGYAQAEDKKRAAAAGFDDYVVKPPSFENLERIVAEGPERRAPDAASSDEQMRALLQ